MKKWIQTYRAWICCGVLGCVLLGFVLYVATQETQEKSENPYTQLVNCAIYYNEFESYGEARPEINEQNWYNLIWDFFRTLSQGTYINKRTICVGRLRPTKSVSLVFSKTLL